MKEEQVNLTNCDREPIHIPGRIQDQGFLIAIDNTTYLTTNLSSNFSKFGQDPKVFLGEPVSKLLAAIYGGNGGEVAEVLSIVRNKGSFDGLNPIQTLLGGREYNVVLSRSQDQIVIEFDPLSENPGIDLQRTLGRSMSKILSGRRLQEVLDLAAEEVRQITGYERVMVYKFLDDGHGQVVSEAKEAHLEPFLDLHYPASDIPKQARALYKINLTRIIADVHAEPAALLSLQQHPLDLSCSVLRAVSPIHIQYLKNMGVASSFSVSLIVYGELWGLISCHNYSPRYIDYKGREACKIIGQILSSALEYREDEEEQEMVDEFRRTSENIYRQLRKEDQLPDALITPGSSFKEVVKATGAVIFLQDSIHTVGITPNEEQLQGLKAWLSNLKEKHFSTHKLVDYYPEASAFAPVACGILVCTISQELGEYLVWFKPEQLETVRWAGNPEKPVLYSEDNIMHLSPRKSFEEWTELVRNTSARWRKEEIASAIRLREEVIFSISRKANEVRLLNEKLKKAYDELDTFSFTISHDLKSPITVIKSYSEILLRNSGNLDPRSRNMIERILNGTEKMTLLIQEVLEYSRIGRTEIQRSIVNVTELVEEIVRDILIGNQAVDVVIEIGGLPELVGEQVMIYQVFNNLISNAIKYSAKSTPPTVKIKGEVKEDELVYSISDNGIGIDVQRYDEVFELFRRMENARSFEGTGVGLSIVKRIVEKHDGRIWYESTIGKGTSFYIAFPKG